MSDERGHLLGRINLLDASIGAIVLVLIPVGYAAFLLFRTPKPAITSVEPAEVTRIEERAGGGSLVAGKLKVRGNGLRPVLRASIDSQPVIAFIFESPTSADVLHGEVGPGAHDLILYDGVQEVARAVGAVKGLQKPALIEGRVRVVGTLIDLDEAAAGALRVGMKYPQEGPALSEIVGLGDTRPDVRDMRTAGARSVVTATGRWQRPAAVLVTCDLSMPDECRVGDEPIGNRVMSIPGAPPALRIRVEEVVPASDPLRADARVRFIGHPELLDVVKVGDVDEGAPAVDGRAAALVSVGSRQLVAGETLVEQSIEGSSDRAGLRAADRLAMFDADLRLGVDASPSGFLYRTRAIKVGTSLTFTTRRYVMRGTVLALNVRSAPPAPPPGEHREK